LGLSYLPGNEVYHALSWDKGIMTDLGTLGGGNSEARDQLERLDSGPEWESHVCQGEGRENRTGTPRHQIFKFNSQAEAINASGQIAGYSNTLAGLRATRWTRK
jgi:uncharacterized membrane protein